MKTTKESLWVGIAISIFFGIAFAIPTYAATSWIWDWLHLAIAIFVGGAVATTLFIEGYQKISIPINYVGVGVRFGDKPTKTLYESGDHWGFPGISGVILVDMRHRRIDLSQKFNASAADTSDVGVDGFVLAHVDARDAAKTLNVQGLDESIRELFESKIRLFTVMVSKAENAIKFRDLLAEYLELKPRDQDVLTPAHQAFEDRLKSLPKRYVAPGGIAALMQKDTAGEFKKLLGEWGVEVEEVEIEQFDVPQVIKDAKLRKATQDTLMAAEKIRNTARSAMVAELVAHGVNANNAMNSVDLLLGLNVKKDVREITITDLDKVAGQLGGQIAGVLERWLNNRSTKP